MLLQFLHHSACFSKAAIYPVDTTSITNGIASAEEKRLPKGHESVRIALDLLIGDAFYSADVLALETAKLIACRASVKVMRT